MYHLKQYVTSVWYSLTKDEALFQNEEFASRILFLQLLPAFTPVIWFIKAKHGRFSSKSSKFNLPGKPAWISMELVSPLMFLCYFSHVPHLSKRNAVISLAFVVHYIHRALIAPIFRAKSLKPMHISVWLAGTVFNFHSGSTIGWWLSSLGKASGSFTLGMLIWALGFSGNIYHDEILFSLRKSLKNKDYSIPFGGLYKYISCPNYFCEIVEWIGLGIAAGRNCSPVWVFVVALVAVLVPRARANHQWLRSTFKDYPSRRALIPFIW